MVFLEEYFSLESVLGNILIHFDDTRRGRVGLELSKIGIFIAQHICQNSCVNLRGMQH